MTKEEFKNVENKLYNYYQKENIINSLNFKINAINKQIEDIENKIKGNKVDITDDGLQAVSYGEKVQTSSAGVSYAEKAIIREIEQLEIECIRKKEIKNRLEEKIRDIELDNSILEYNISFLSEKDKKFLENKYKKHIPSWQLAQEIHVSEVTARRIKRKLINNINNWIAWLK